MYVDEIEQQRKHFVAQKHSILGRSEVKKAVSDCGPLRGGSIRVGSILIINDTQGRRGSFFFAFLTQILMHFEIC